MKSLLLNIDTSMPQASICLSRDGECIELLKNQSQKDHAGWLHAAIEQMLQENGIRLKELDAISVTAGPGSYTGLRISMAAAKGFCFILNKPLILVNTLETMAYSATQPGNGETETLYCPMIDARRMEVFTAVYDYNLTSLMPSTAVILDEEFDNSLPEGRHIVVFGNGSTKYQGKHQVLTEVQTDASHLAHLATVRFREKNFTPVDQAVPLYGKAFFTPSVK